MEEQDRRDAPDSLTVVIPVFNEQATLRRAVERLLKTDLPVAVEVLVVDDGSTDRSLESIQDLVDDGLVQAVRHEANRGKGAALRTALGSATGDLVTVLDADLEYDPADYAPMLSVFIHDEAQVVYGMRSFGAHTAYSFWYVIGNRLVAFWASFLFNTWLTDLETCFKMARREAWLSLDLKQDGFGIEAEVTGKLLARGYSIHEVPIRYRARTREEGKKLQWTDGLKALAILLAIRARKTPVSQRDAA